VIPTESCSTHQIYSCGTDARGSFVLLRIEEANLMIFHLRTSVVVRWEVISLIVLNNTPGGDHMMMLIGRGKKSVSAARTDSPAGVGVVPPFHLRGLPSFLPNSTMGFSREHV
jgi:hypothetical protein